MCMEIFLQRLAKRKLNFSFRKNWDCCKLSCIMWDSKILDHPEKSGEGRNGVTKAQMTYSEHKMILVQSNLNCAKICFFSLKLLAANGQDKCFCLNQGQKTHEHHLLKMLDCCIRARGSSGWQTVLHSEILILIEYFKVFLFFFITEIQIHWKTALYF